MRRPSDSLTEPARNLEESVGSPSPTTPDPTTDLSLPPPEEQIVSQQADADVNVDPATVTPPPHIAARLFIRPTNQTRRKDSAASSRRNSFSSAHSRSSHGCGRDVGPQSKYVAQHLRRASILEDRKARLADRAAHAEKVRIRAAKAKATVKDITQSEERAIAAAMARERNLAEIAAACAEEVKRAKQIAETMKEKREQENKKLKMQMEERLAEAERRREELRNRNAAKVKCRERGQSLVTRKPTLVEVMPEVKEVKERESSPMRPEAAASRIQWWWRSMSRKRAVAEFSALGLTIDVVRETSFDTVTSLLSQENVLVATSRVLRICGLNEGAPGSVEEMTAVRSFLSAFLILGHPSQVLSNKEGTGEPEQVGSALAKPIPRDDLANPQLQELVGKAGDLLISFENILGRLTAFNNYTPPPALLESFPEVYATFYNAFIAWKARDSSSLVELMVMQFVELDAIWESVKDSTDGSVDQVYRESIRENQLLLLVRIKKLAGPVRGKQLVTEAVRVARKARVKKPRGDLRPRVAEQSESETGMGVLGDGSNQGQQTQTPTPPSTPARQGETFKISVVLPHTKSLLPENRVVVHELAINRDFRTEPSEYHEQQAHLLAPLFQEMRATMQADNQEVHFMLLLRVADMIREKLQRLVRPGNPMHTLIGELLDTEMAQRQFAMGSFSYEKLFQAMGTLLPKLCAPVRDDEVKVLAEEKLVQGTYVDRLEALNAFIDVMLSDYANYLLQQAAPQLIEQAPSYEAKAFAADIEAGRYDLSAAKAAWRAARVKLMGEASRRDPEGVDLSRSRLTANKIYNQMLVDLFTQPHPLSLDEMPEMLRLDHKRVVEAGRVTKRIITTGAILLQCKNLLKRDVRGPWRTESQRILAVLERSESSLEPVPTDQTVDRILTALEAGRSMPAATKVHLRAFVTKLVLSAASITAENREPSDPVLRLLLSRLRAYVLQRLAASASASENVKATSTAGEKLAGLGLAEFVDKVRDLVEMLGRVGEVDRGAHGVWWDQVAEAVEREAQ
ncbi:T-complex protein 11 domain-containing protein [Neurospora intermedia]|uniref:T-complex protein 11 domain-containing protein n=1 Tax=Neurospora intermedia TaxID=5142 RepID=A0ABR3CXH1_NEUIN